MALEQRSCVIRSRRLMTQVHGDRAKILRHCEAEGCGNPGDNLCDLQFYLFHSITQQRLFDNSAIRPLTLATSSTGFHSSGP